MKYLFPLFLLLPFTFNAQDFNGSLPELTAVKFNPAATGLAAGAAHRVLLGYRTQWGNFDPSMGAFHDYQLSYDVQFANDDLFVGLGGALFHQQVGANRLNSTTLTLSASTGIRLSDGANRLGKVYLSGGAQLNARNYRLRPYDLSFNEQFDTGTGFYNPALDNGEAFGEGPFSELLMSFGAGVLLYSTVKKTSDFSFTLGASFNHLNNPELAFFDMPGSPEAFLERKFVAHGSFYVPFKPGQSVQKWGLRPRAIFIQQGGHVQYHSGLDLRRIYSINRRVRGHFALGVAARMNRGTGNPFARADALITKLALRYDDWLIAAAYDLNTSGLRRATRWFGGVEVLAAYAMGSGAEFNGGNSRRKKPKLFGLGGDVTCPAGF